MALRSIFNKFNGLLNGDKGEEIKKEEIDHIYKLKYNIKRMNGSRFLNKNIVDALDH